VLSSSFPEDILQQLIMRQKALPLTPDMDNIMDDMEVWGRSVHYDWYCDVVEWLAHILTNGVAVGRKQIIKDCIEYRLKHVVYKHYGINSPVAGLLFDEWAEYYDNAYVGTYKQFRHYTVESRQFMLYSLAQSLHVPDTYVPNNVVSSDSSVSSIDISESS
jgi:fructose-1,6-bisphosphatase